ncbi:MAG: aldehyde dehydrogenase family protein, partial [Actinobacteria bacterium]|nr:aldehyde dehydrogenase family protein [Actinomycetota bacterium]
ADLERTLDEAMLAKFRNCGQSCIAANIFYVQDGLYEAFVDGFANRISALQLGDPLREETALGPVINPQRRRGLEDLLQRAQDEGFELVASGTGPPKRAGLSPECFCAPSMLAAPSFEKIDPRLLFTEVFGPMALATGFSDLDDLLRHLSANPLGLAAYVFSQDESRAQRLG